MKIIDQIKGFNVLELLRETGALLDGHFKLSSGLHSGNYVQCARLLQFPSKTAELVRASIKEYPGFLNSSHIDTVISPAMGGIFFGYMLAYELGVKMIFTERKEKIMELRRGFKIMPGEKILIAEDVITTGGSVFEVMEICRENKADIKGVISIVDRSENMILDYPYYHLIKMEIEKYEPENCPFCKKNEEIDYPGSRK